MSLRPWLPTGGLLFHPFTPLMPQLNRAFLRESEV